MTKHFCDNCGAESRGDVATKKLWVAEDAGGRCGEFTVEIDFTGAELCKNCQFEFLIVAYWGGTMVECPESINEPFKSVIEYTIQQRNKKGLPW